MRHRPSYHRFGTFKGLLFLGAVVLIVSVLVYTQVLIEELRGNARRSLARTVERYKEFVKSENELLTTIALQQIQEVDFPIIVTDANGVPKNWKNVDVESGDTSSEALAKLKQLISIMDRRGNEPLNIEVAEGQVDWFHYGDSAVIRQLRWLPWIEIIAAALFIIVGYTGFRNIQRSEERMVWVGLAKETAHQLGTPLTSMLGWLELLRGEGVQSRALGEMTRDIRRLEKVTARFSQIGSEEVLTPHSIEEVVKETIDYFRSRLPKTGFPIEIVEKVNCDVPVPLNRELFAWVLENLIKNSLDSLDEVNGNILIHCFCRGPKVIIDVTDNGRGIELRNRKHIFRPGFSTKKRGWGLGLSLARRIVEEYHGGRLILKESTPGQGTTMRIVLKSSLDVT
ncbi:HAMP domain-containing histidine kinase [bacterium]|nr:HAMP domain-containing histidine kinase [bacterium]MBU1937106.1 HAMP domain-containing histidine kinase [bacterium]